VSICLFVNSGTRGRQESALPSIICLRLLHMTRTATRHCQIASARMYNPLAFSRSLMSDPACQHKRTQLIAKDDDTQYVECLDCGEIFEVGELNDGTGAGESLSDA
jgi:hypothetical protein